MIIISGNRGSGNRGGKGRKGGPKSAGPGGECICPNCGTTEPHQQGEPCYQKTCPNCGTKMQRK